MASCFTHRFPKSLPFVIIDTLEKAYIAGFAVLQLFVTLFPLWAKGSSVPADVRVSATTVGCGTDGTPDCVTRDPSANTRSVSNLEFLPLMLTSIYCAIGLVWAFIRLSVLYLRQSEGVMWT